MQTLVAGRNQNDAGDENRLPAGNSAKAQGYTVNNPWLLVEHEARRCQLWFVTVQQSLLEFNYLPHVAMASINK